MTYKVGGSCPEPHFALSDRLFGEEEGRRRKVSSLQISQTIQKWQQEPGVGSAGRHLPSLTPWVWSLGSVWWKERTDLCRLPSDFHTYTHPSTNIWISKKYNKLQHTVLSALSPFRYTVFDHQPHRRGVSSSRDNLEITLGFFLLRIFNFVLSLSLPVWVWRSVETRRRHQTSLQAELQVAGLKLPYLRVGNRTCVLCKSEWTLSATESSLQLQLWVSKGTF